MNLEDTPLIDSRDFDTKREGFGYAGQTLMQLMAVVIGVTSTIGILVVVMTQEDLVGRISLLVILPFILLVLAASFIDSGLRRLGTLPIQLRQDGILIHVKKGLSRRSAFVPASEIRAIDLIYSGRSSSPYAFVIRLSNGNTAHSGKRPRIEMTAYCEQLERMRPRIGISKIRE